MIHHYSIPVQDTKKVAEILADFFGGTITGFGPYPNSYIVWLGDEFGSAIELYPAGTEMHPDSGKGQANFRHSNIHSRFCATHAAISTTCSREEIFKVAVAHGWKALELSRGGFNVIEFWIENSVMIELLTSDMAKDYLSATRRFMKPA